MAADAIRALGHPGYVSEPGEWGPLINGGAWLTVDGIAVDVLYRDLDVVEQRVADARAGRFEAMLADAVLSVAHARLAARREWVFNEKRLVERAGLQAVAPLVASSEVAGVAELLGVAPLRPR